MNTIQPGTMVTRLHALGPHDVKVLSVSILSNTALVQIRDFDQTPSAQNTYTVILDTLRAKAS